MSIRHAKICSLALILAGAAVGLRPIALAAAAVPRIDLTVRVYYQTAGLPAALQNRALAEAATVLRAALVDVHWQNCTRVTSSSPCRVPPAPSELLLVVRERAACEETPVTLGEALIHRRAGGVRATVYFDCIASLATETGTDAGLLLGRVVAHELGHLMMRSSAHARGGLMRPKWTRDELRHNRAADWAFTASDVAAMRQPGRE